MSTPRPAAASNIDVERLFGHYALMARIRAFEEAGLAALKKGLVLGAIHPSIGQEAVAAGVCSNLRRDDVMLSTHRGHGHTIAKGADAGAMMRELFGRQGGSCGGKGGSMHIADFSVGMLGANGVVGANIGIAAGAAHAIRLTARGKGSDRIVCCLFGDGAVNRGPFLEGLNWARVFDLPILFVCEDNGFAATTRTSAMTGGPGPAARAESLGIPAAEIDGNDVALVDAAARDLIAAVRGGGGPRFLVANTYRLMGHTAADAAPYRSREEVEEKRRGDPLLFCAELLRGAGVAEERLAGARAAAEEEMAQASAAAEAAPWPEAGLAFADVQDVGADARRAAHG